MRFSGKETIQKQGNKYKKKTTLQLKVKEIKAVKSHKKDKSFFVKNSNWFRVHERITCSEDTPIGLVYGV